MCGLYIYICLYFWDSGNWPFHAISQLSAGGSSEREVQVPVGRRCCNQPAGRNGRGPGKRCLRTQLQSAHLQRLGLLQTQRRDWPCPASVGADFQIITGLPLGTKRNRWNRKPEPLEPFHPQTVTEPNRTGATLHFAQWLRKFRALRHEIILQKYVGAVAEWPLRISIPGSMLQNSKKAESNKSTFLRVISCSRLRQFRAILQKIIPQKLPLGTKSLHSKFRWAFKMHVM